MAKSRKAPAADPIRHVILLMLENRSFDHMLGSLQAVYPNLDGIPPGEPQRYNEDDEGNRYHQEPGAARIIMRDLHHDHHNVIAQMKNGMGGFIIDYVHAFPQADQAERAEIMKYHELDSLPALHALARQFTICDHWFSSVPGPTWTNRLFCYSGTSKGIVEMPSNLFDGRIHHYDQDNLFDRLNEKGKSWRVYYGDVPNSLLLVHQYDPRNLARYRPLDQFADDAAGAADDFPEFCLLEPRYFGQDADDDHPVHDVMSGERLVADVYNALRGNDALWRSSLLVLLFDEHGGFYDHVTPPAAIPPDDDWDEYRFDQLGVRIPALLVSPRVGKGVLSTIFDHTSLLRYLTDKWKLGPLGRRTAQAASFAGAILPAARDDTPASVPRPRFWGATAHTEAPALNDLQSALLGLSHFLETRANPDPAVVARRSQALTEGPKAQAAVASERADDFIKQLKSDGQ